MTINNISAKDFSLLQEIYGVCVQVVNMNSVSKEAKEDYVFHGLMAKTVFETIENFPFDRNEKKDFNKFLNVLDNYLKIVIL